jgi:hypothetical protein
VLCCVLCVAVVSCVFQLRLVQPKHDTTLLECDSHSTGLVEGEGMLSRLSRELCHVYPKHDTMLLECDSHSTGLMEGEGMLSLSTIREPGPSPLVQHQQYKAP